MIHYLHLHLMQTIATQNLKTDIFIVEPLLCDANGHPVEYVTGFSCSAKKAYPESRVVVLSAKIDEKLRPVLASIKEIDHFEECFPSPLRARVEDWHPPRFIIGRARRNAIQLAKALRKTKVSSKAVFFFPTFDMGSIFMVGFLRLLMPFVDFRTIGILRIDPLYSVNGVQVVTNQKKLQNTIGLNLLWKLSFWKSKLYADSKPLCELYYRFFGLKCRLSPHLVMGCWSGEKGESETKIARRGKLPIRVGFVGLPGGSVRNFPLFVLTGLALEEERLNGEIEFVATMPPGCLGSGPDNPFIRILELGLRGLRLDRKDMPDATDFAQTIAECDIFWNLGDPSHFVRGTSGRLVYSVCLGKKTITNKSEWLASIRKPCRLIREVDPNLDAVIAVMKEMMHSEYEPACYEEIRRWREMFSRKAWDEFVCDSITRVTA